MNKKSLSISIGLPVYNGDNHLDRAISSLLGQSYNNFELIISDNASIDKTEKICLKFKKKDKRIRYYRNHKNLGAIWNFNRVFNLAKGKYFMWASADDYWLPDYLKSCFERFKQSTKVILVGTECKLINGQTEKKIYTDKGFSTVGMSPQLRLKTYKKIIHSGNHAGTILYGLHKKNILYKTMPFKNIICSDHLLLAQLSLLGEFVTIPKVLMIKRSGGTSKSIQNIAKVIGLTNNFMISFPYLIREFYFQKIIFLSNKLNMAEKINLSLWSFTNYARRFINKTIAKLKH